MSDSFRVQYQYNDNYTPKYKLTEKYDKCVVESYAGKLLEEMESRLAIVYLDNDDIVRVMESKGRVCNYFDFTLETD